VKSRSSQSFDVLQTRLYRPQPPGSLLVRPALVELLDFETPKVLTLVIAPAGFGKTTLVSSRLDEKQYQDIHNKPDCLPSAWLTIDKNDQSFIIFLRHFIAALRKIIPEACPESFKLAHANSEMAEESIQLVLTNEIADLSQPFVMVLDDFHRTSCPQLYALLSGWARHWPLPMHLVIISRTQPPLPLAKLKSQGKINDIRSRDLRFSPQEAEDYIRLTTYSDPGEKTLADLLNHLEGWAAGLKLVSIALNQTNVGQDIESVLSLGKQDMFSFLADEVFVQMTTAMQRLFMKMSILDNFSASLCLALVDEDDLDESVNAFLENITGADLFITALHSKDEWYQMHNLMRNMLQNRLSKNFRPEQIKEMHMRASYWYTGQNLLEPALEHAIKADNSSMIAELLDQTIFAALDSEDFLIVDRLMQTVTEEMKTIYPQFLFYKAWQKLSRWSIDDIKNIIGQAEKILKSAKPDSFKNQDFLFGQLAFFKGYLAFTSNNSKEAVKFCGKALDAFPTRLNYINGMGVFYYGLSMQSCEGAQNAATYLQQSYRECDNKDNSFAFSHLFALATIYLQDGDLKASEHYAHLLLEKGRKNKALQLEGYALVILGFVNYQWNKLDLAEKWYQELYKMFSLTKVTLTRLGYIGLILALQARGKFSEALEINNELIERDIELFGRFTEWTQVSRLQILASQNQWKEAERWADEYREPFVSDFFMPNTENPHVFKAKVFINRNDPKDLPIIMEILGKYVEITSKTNNNRCKAEALALSTMAEANAGNNDAARDLLIESLKIAARGKMIRLYLDLGSQMHRLLKQVAPVPEIAEFVQDTLTAFAEINAGQLITNQTEKGQPGIYTDGLELPFHEKLSLRETEVLHLMAEAISLQEIADRLFISYATAKRHTVNIYSKLGVHSRWEAVSFARKYGIV
jgi:LuxR family transcriptional regulator, maltose regulon positive regulatory protein